MGQATVDLPDPMQSPAAPVTAGTDDLLAQLAGDEIERLLAETETERPAPAADAAPPLTDAAKSASSESAAPTPMPSPAARADLDAVPLSTGVAPVADVSTAIDPAEEEDLTSQLGALFESLDAAATSPATATPTAPATPPAAAGSPEPAASPIMPQASLPAATPIDTASSSAELKALGEPIAAHSPAVATDAAALAQSIPEATLPEEVDEPRPSLLLRLLEFINSPLGHCSDSVRQTVGKIAIATLLNAIAVLAYTLIFRRH